MTTEIITVKGVFKGCTIVSEDGEKYYLRVFRSHPIRTGFFQLKKGPRYWSIIRELSVET